MKKVILFLTAILVFCALPGLSSATRNKAYDAALKAYYGGHYSKAVKDLKVYVNRRPDAAAYYLIGYGLYKLRKFSEATEYFDQAYLIDPTFSPEVIGFEKFAKGKPWKPVKHSHVRKKSGHRKKTVKPEKRRKHLK